jgi:hypothetical protein
MEFIKIGLKCHFAHFQEKYEAPPKSMQQWGAKQVCEQMKRDACTR